MIFWIHNTPNQNCIKETRVCLDKVAYDLSSKKNMPAGKNALLTYKLERELGMHTIPLREVKLLALEYYRKHPELFKGIAEEEMISYSIS